MAIPRRAPEVAYRGSRFNEEKLIYRRIAIVTLLTFAISLVIFFYGVPFIRFVGSLGQKLNRPEASSSVTDETPPPRTPRLDYLPQYTNKSKLEIKGFTDPTVKVNLTLNNLEPASSTSDENGSFEFLNITLKEGSNEFKVVAIRGGKSSGETTGSIIFDKKPPILEIFEPGDNAFFPKQTKEIKVSGKTEADAVVTINELQAIVNQEGHFNFSLPANQALQKIKITARDAASNQSIVEKTIKVDLEIPSPSATASAQVAQP